MKKLSFFLVAIMVFMCSCGGNVTEPFQTNPETSSAPLQIVSNITESNVGIDTVHVVAIAPVNKKSYSVGGIVTLMLAKQ